MRLANYTAAASTLALGLAALLTPNVQGQPLYDRVNVNLPYSVSIGNTTLQPGNYVIQQLQSSAGDSRVLLIYGDNGMKFETSAMTIPAYNGTTQDNTKVLLHHFGNDYYFDKVWIQGKDYGYEFPLPDSVKSRQKEMMQPVSVAATYSTATAQQAATAQKTTSSATTAQSTMQQTTTGKATTGQATTGTATTGRATTQQATNQQSTMQQTTTGTATTGTATTGRATTGQMTTQQRTTSQPVTTAQNTMSAANSNNSADRESPSMPHTSAGWLMMLLSGGALSGLGMTLRRKA